MRHRPHLFRGCRILKKGELRGGNPKKKRRRCKKEGLRVELKAEEEEGEGGGDRGMTGMTGSVVVVGLVLAMYMLI